MVIIQAQHGPGSLQAPREETDVVWEGAIPGGAKQEAKLRAMGPVCLRLHGIVLLAVSHLTLTLRLHGIVLLAVSEL